jgi:hypothetical protein
VNLQTIEEGSTCLHLCGKWGSKKCFDLLIAFGGANLQLKDKQSKGIMNMCFENKNK